MILYRAALSQNETKFFMQKSIYILDLRPVLDESTNNHELYLYGLMFINDIFVFFIYIYFCLYDDYCIKRFTLGKLKPKE